MRASDSVWIVVFFPVSRKGSGYTVVPFRIIITLHWNLPSWTGGLQFCMVALKAF